MTECIHWRSVSLGRDRPDRPGAASTFGRGPQAHTLPGSKVHGGLKQSGRATSVAVCCRELPLLATFQVQVIGRGGMRSGWVFWPLDQQKVVVVHKKMSANIVLRQHSCASPLDVSSPASGLKAWLVV